MSNNQLQNVNNNTPSFSDGLLRETHKLPEETQNELRKYAARKQIESEFELREAKLKEVEVSSDMYKHMQARKQMQMDSFTKGADKITTDIDTNTGHIKIESRSGNCYVATATYQDEFHPNVILLRDYRDRYLRNSLPGRLFIKFYYTFGPYAAYFPTHSKKIRTFSKQLIDAIVTIIKKKYYQ